MAITPEEFNNVCAEFGLIRIDEQKHHPTSGWWAFPAEVQMGRRIRCPEIAEWVIHRNEPLVFNSTSDHLGDGLKPNTIEELRKYLEEVYKFWKTLAVEYQQKCIDDVLKNLD